MAAAAAAVSVTASSSDAPNGKATDLRSTFEQVYNRLKSELLEDPAFDFTDDSRQWIERMLDHNVPGGKLNRGLSVIDSYRLLRQGMEISTDEVFLGCVLGWCIEWLQAYFLVLDDIMDGSLTRRGQPCWFRVPKANFLERPDVTNPHVGYMKWPKLFNSLLTAVSLPLYLFQLVEWRVIIDSNASIIIYALYVGFIAVNDGVLLRNHIPRILKRHFREKPYYVDLLDLFNEVEFQTASGQMLDLITTHEGEKDLSKYKMPVYRRIVQYKTAYYSFYLPVACALVMSGENLENFINVKNILIDMGTYFQVQDDYLDCFGDPQVIGKIGTDIEDFKCSWLVVQALECADENEKKILSENYGKPGSEHVASVKTLYKDLELQAVFLEYERESYERLTASIDALPSKSVQEVLKSFLGKIYKRQK